MDAPRSILLPEQPSAYGSYAARMLSECPGEVFGAPLRSSDNRAESKFTFGA